MVDSWYFQDRVVPEGMSQVARQLEVGNHKRRTRNTRLSSGTSAGTLCGNPGGRIVREFRRQFLYPAGHCCVPHLAAYLWTPCSRRPRLSAALFRLRLLPKLQEHRFPPARVMSARCYAIEKAFLDKPVQGSELRCVALYKGTAAPLPLCLKEIPSASSVHFRGVVCAAHRLAIPTFTKESPAALCLDETSSAAAVCSVLLLQLAQSGVLLLQVLNSGHDGPVLLLTLLGVGSSLCCS